jgi:hypothetical protein
VQGNSILKVTFRHVKVIQYDNTTKNLPVKLISASKAKADYKSQMQMPKLVNMTQYRLTVTRRVLVEKLDVSAGL